MHFDGEIQFRVYRRGGADDLCFKHAVQAAMAGMDVETRLIEIGDGRCYICVTDAAKIDPPAPPAQP